jgi:hypothetical protein
MTRALIARERSVWRELKDETKGFLRDRKRRREKREQYGNLVKVLVVEFQQ